MSAQVSRRYARALFDLIEDGVDMRKDLAAVAAVVSTAEVEALLASPEYPSTLKRDVIVKGAGGVSAEAERLVAMLAERGKLALLPEIEALVEEMVQLAQSEVEAEVTVASPIDDQVQERLSNALAASTGKKIRLSVTEDKSILGGMVVRIGDRKIDYSLRTKLAGMRRVLAS